MPDTTTSGSQGRAMRSQRARIGRRLERLPLTSDAMTQLAGFGARAARRAPGAPGGWSRFLAARLWWIVLVTMVTVGGAAAFARSQTPTYSSDALVSVWFSASEAAGAQQAPDMATEKGVVSSGVVIRMAAAALAMRHPSDLLGGLSVNVPASTFLLQISYSGPSPHVARRRAQAIAEAYVRYRTAAPVSTKTAFGAGSEQVNPTATLITAASRPSSPSSPSYPLDLGVALALGLVLGIVTAALRDHFDDRVRGPLDLSAQTGAAVLALIPSFRSGRRTPARRLVMARAAGSVAAEAYRVLRTRVIQAAGSREAKTLLVTSPAWEDKGAVAANLAVALAQSGRSTALVCADTRWGRTHEAFGLPNTPGLSQVLSGQVSLLGALSATAIPRLRLLPPGEAPLDPAGLLQSPALGAIATELRQHFDFVVIEAPPLLAAPDAGLLGEASDMILVVADRRRSARAQVRAASRELEQMRGKLIGWMLDNVGRRRRLRTSPAPRQEPAADGHSPGTYSQLDPSIPLSAPATGSKTDINQVPHVALATQRRDLTESED